MKPHKVRPGYKLFPVKFEKFDEIPNEWDEKPLDFFLEINMGQSPPSNSYNDQENGPAFLQGVSEFGETYPETKVWCSEPKKVCDSNEILFSVRAPVGKTNISKTRTCIGRGLAALKPKKNYDLKYCYYILQFFSNRFIPYSEGTTYDAINKDDIKKVIFPFTKNILEEEKIASILLNIDDLIQKQEQVIGQSQKIMKGQRQKLLTQGIGHTEFKKEPWLFQTEIEIPVEWEINTLGPSTEYVGSGSTPKGGSRIYKESGIPIIRSQNVQFEGLTFKNMAYITQEIHDTMSRTKLQDFDVLLNITGASIGRCTLLPENFGEANVNQHVCIIRTKDNLDPDFLSKYLSSYYGQQLILRWQNGGTKEGLNFKQIKSFKIICPPLPEQQKIASILSNLDSLIQQEKQYKAKLVKIKKGLMQQLLTGKLRVKYD